MCDLLQKLELLHAAGTQITPPHATEIVKTLYEILTILDGKGLALLAFDGIVVAATTFVAEKGDVFRKPGLARWLAILVIVVSLAAAALCLGVSEVSYPFLHYVECGGAGQTGLFRRDNSPDDSGRLADRVLSDRLDFFDYRNSIVFDHVLGVAELAQSTAVQRK